MSSLRRFQTNPTNLLSTALSMYRSKCIKTVVVEGVCDKRFLTQWIAPGTKIRFDGFDGKELVERTFSSSRKQPFLSHDFLYFFADIDFDGIASKRLHDHPSFIYHVFCFDNHKILFNDLETYLLSTAALEKLLANYDITPETTANIRTRLEKASRKLGAYRAADLVVQKSEGLRSSILNGLEVRAFFHSKEIDVDVSALKKYVFTG